MQYISNKNNLDDPEIAALTLEDIRAYVMGADEDDALRFESKAMWSLKGSVRLRFGDYDVADKILKEDLAVLSRVFSDEGIFSFEMKLRTEPDNHGKDVLVGYQIKGGMPEKLTIADTRTCCYCREPVFDHAGTAEHRNVVLIGYHGAGKLSALLALTHYALNAIKGVTPGDPVWSGVKSLDAVDCMELLSPSDWLMEDLKNYANGIAPKRGFRVLPREWRQNATFRIKNKGQDKHYLLTLRTLPGDLRDPVTGEIDGINILNHFPVALVCDAFVLCFESTAVRSGETKRMAMNAWELADQIQKLREEYNKNCGKDREAYNQLRKKNTGDGLYAPMMILFTKDPELECGHGPKAPRPAKELDPIKNCYIFADEKRKIEANPAYREVMQCVKRYDALKYAYRACLRCSPYGFLPPSYWAVEYGHSTNRNPDGTVMRPRPRHVEDLMQWILEVCGCVPSSAVYRPDLDPTSTREFRPGNNFLTRTQYRALCPRDEKEALIRCYLFENPGRFDEDFVSDYDQPLRLFIDRIKGKFKRNGE
jgi:hypothetical protein